MILLRCDLPVVGAGLGRRGAPVDPGGVNSETTSWMWRPPLLITNRMLMTPVEPVGTGAFKLITMLPVQSELTV